MIFLTFFTIFNDCWVEIEIENIQRILVKLSLSTVLLLLDEAVASRALFVIVSGGMDGRTETLLEPAK